MLKVCKINLLLLIINNQHCIELHYVQSSFTYIALFDFHRNFMGRQDKSLLSPFGNVQKS